MKDKNKIENEKTESAESIGQQILGELEIIGGILTADPVTRSEGAFNVEAGSIHHHASEDLHKNEDKTQDD